MTTEIKLTDWDSVTTELQQFGTTGEVTTSDDSIRVELGSAYIEVRRGGTISTGMPLHELEHAGDGSLIVDHKHNTISIKTESLDYTFRRP
ncbi:MAG: hypothetical protein J07HN4v3_01727 [Halonotius sp. J07HN4]|nr:MAG: hypothetical protein J07HN4v3_01727 [Halonotius sp. J07HN4]